jgi:hypothetical protein
MPTFISLTPGFHSSALKSRIGRHHVAPSGRRFCGNVQRCVKTLKRFGWAVSRAHRMAIGEAGRGVPGLPVSADQVLQLASQQRTRQPGSALAGIGENRSFRFRAPDINTRRSANGRDWRIPVGRLWGVPIGWASVQLVWWVKEKAPISRMSSGERPGKPLCVED